MSAAEIIGMPRGRTPQTDPFCIAADTIRVLAAEAVQRANSGHPGMPMGMADAAVVLWSLFLKHDPAAPDWWDRDRFVLSAGHGSMLLYALLHLSGYDLPLAELMRFRQLGSRTPGHPERGLTAGVETTTGPLGQGVGNAVGLALAERWLAERYNRPGFKVVDHRTYVIASDGDLMEGISHEAGSLAGHLGLNKLTVLYDDNRISIDGPTGLSFSEDIVGRFTAYGWHVELTNGNWPADVEAALRKAAADPRPSLIACRTRIGFGSPNREGTNKAHGEPLGAEEVRLVKQQLGWPADQEFFVPETARAFLEAAAARGSHRRAEWEQRFARYEHAHPELATELRAAMAGKLPGDWATTLPSFSSGKPMATRAASGAVIDALAPRLPTLIGGSADLTPSNNTQPRAETGRPISRDDFAGHYIHFGVREHGMAAILNGLALHGGVRPYGGTFLVFSDYMRPAVRLAALMGLPVVFIFTHDSVGLGEDGPTHQPVEHLTALRAIPNLIVLRPADANETVEAWRAALEQTETPTALVLTRQAVPVLDRDQLAPAAGVRRGAYILADADPFDVILIATGSEVQLALEARELLMRENVRVRVVSMPSRELFEQQDAEYRESVLPARVAARVSVEAGATLGWGAYVGLQGASVGLDRFGASAPGAEVFRHVGLTADAVVAAARRVLRDAR
ncbi:MAG TPA: transketolase [Longimicrobiales bacterium]|nr:transketolase [Longimicrobiales bacterium]